MEIFSFGWWTSQNITDVRNVGLLLLGIIGLPLAVWRSVLASKQTRLAESGQNTDRFQKGASMLGDARISVREAGIVTLEQVVILAPNTYFTPVQKVLCAFVRDRSREQREQYFEERKAWVDSQPKAGNTKAKQPVSLEKEPLYPNISPDAQSALIAIGHLRKSLGEDLEMLNETFNLTNINMKSARLSQLILTECDFTGSVISSVTIVNCKFRNTSFSHSLFKNGQFINCDFEGGFFREISIKGTSFYECSVEEATFTGAQISDAKFSRTDLSKSLMDTEMAESLTDS